MSAHIYSASGKYSQRFTFSTFCYVIALFQNGWNSLFSSKFYKQYPIMTMWKKFVWNLCKFIKIKKRKKSHVHKYSQPLLNTIVEAPLAPITASNLFGYDATGSANHHLAIICHSSPHLFSSQALSGWMGADAHFQVSPEIFDWVQSQAEAGPLKDIHRVVYKTLLLCALGPLSCWKVNLLPCLRFWMLWTGFSLRLSLYFGALSFSSTLMSPSVPAAEKQPHSMSSTLQVMSRAGFLQTWCLELRFIRPETLVSQSLRVL